MSYWIWCTLHWNLSTNLYTLDLFLNKSLLWAMFSDTRCYYGERKICQNSKLLKKSKSRNITQKNVSKLMSSKPSTQKIKPSTWRYFLSKIHMAWCWWIFFGPTLDVFSKEGLCLSAGGRSWVGAGTCRWTCASEVEKEDLWVTWKNVASCVFFDWKKANFSNKLGGFN